MAYSFLDKINDSLKEVGEIQGSDGELASFTDAGRQREIDVMLKAWNDAISQIQDLGTFSGEEAEGTLTLVVDTREYSLPTDFSKITGTFIDETNSQRITPYPGGYEQMRNDQWQPDKFIGLPYRYAINPVTNKFRMDRTPQTEEDGRVYKYTYEKYIFLSLITDTFPWNDRIVDALQDVAVQRWERKLKGQFDEKTFNTSKAHAATLMRQAEPFNWYGVRRANSFNARGEI